MTIEEKSLLEDSVMWQCIAALGIKPTYLKHLRQWKYYYCSKQAYGEDKEICGFGESIYQAAKAFYEQI